MQGGDSSDTPANERQWQTEVIRRTLAHTRETSTRSNKFRDLHAKLVSILNEIVGKPGLTTQDLIDELYTQVVPQIGSKQTNSKGQWDLRTRPAVRGKGGDIYTRTQELFHKNPKLLARYIREGTPWIEDEGSGSPKPEEVKSFYKALLGTNLT
jgi:hypothetical protein